MYVVICEIYVNKKAPMPPATTMTVIGMTMTVYVFKCGASFMTRIVAIAAVTPAVITSPIPAITNAPSLIRTAPLPT